MTTPMPPPGRRKADCPNHSTRMVLLGSWEERDLAVVEAAAAQQRRRGGDQAGDDREREGRVQAVPERSEMGCGKNPGPVTAPPGPGRRTPLLHRAHRGGP